MFHQCREFPFEENMKEVEVRLIARGFKKAINEHSDLKAREYRVKLYFGIQESSQEPLRYGIEWIEG